MKKVLGLIGSPRRMGNCEIMVKEISRNIGRPCDLRLLALNEFNILPCRGCYRCLLKAQRCVLEDDFHQILEAICEADALIVAAPTYFLGANASLKRFLDRGLAFYACLDRLWGKAAVGVGIAGIEGKEGYTLLVINSFINLLFAQGKLSKICYAALPGEVMLSDANKQAARALGTALFAPPAAYSQTSCPLCGGDAFRFLGGNEVRCMLCSNAGRIEMKAETPVFHINPSRHELFLSKRDALAHKDWLLQMKDRYLKHKTRLKEIYRPYLIEGSRIEPPQKSKARK